jgi:hypothetical protein
MLADFNHRLAARLDSLEDGHSRASIIYSVCECLQSDYLESSEDYDSSI